MKPVFIDTNIFIYAAGKPSPFKEPSLALLRRIAGGELEACCSAEVLQEVLSRQWRIKDFDGGIQIVEEILSVISRVIAVTREDVIKAVEVLKESGYEIQPRDAIHAAIMLNNGIEDIYSYDRHFDRVGGIKRLEPE